MCPSSSPENAPDVENDRASRPRRPLLLLSVTPSSAGACSACCQPTTPSWSPPHMAVTTSATPDPYAVPDPALTNRTRTLGDLR